MEKLQFKTFVWPQNPHTYQESLRREPVYVKNEEDILVFAGMGALIRTVTGQGVFFGDSAFDSFRALAALFADDSAGILQHPVWGSRKVRFTELELTQEPKENCVSYRFTFRGTDDSGAIPA